MRILLLTPLHYRERWSMQLYGHQLAASLRPLLGDGDEVRVYPGEDWIPHVTGPLRYADHYLSYGLRAARIPADIYHITDHGYSNLIPFLRGRRTVVTFHDALLMRLQDRSLPVSWKPRTAILAARYGLHCIRQASRVVTVSDFSRGELETLLGPACPPVTAIPNGVDPLFLEAPPEDFRAECRRRWNLDSRPVILSPGRSDPHKNIEGALSAFAILVQKHGRDALFLKVGSWLTDSQRALAARLGIQDRLRMTGPLSGMRDMAAAYHLSSALVFLSYYEGFGLPVLEAFAAGLPVVCSNRTAVREVGGEDAWQVSPESPAEAASALHVILEKNPEVMRKIAAGRSRAVKFTWDKTARSVLNLYRSLHRGGTSC